MSASNKENNPTSAVHNKFAKLLSSYTGDDPLVSYLDFKAALENVKASKEEIARVQARAYDTFRGNPRYADDERFVRLCLELIDSTKREDMFAEMAQAGIGHSSALFYRLWARVLQKRGAHADAVVLLESSLARCPAIDRKKIQAALDDARTHLPAKARAPLSVVAPSSAIVGATRAMEQSAYNRDMFIGPKGEEISFEERRAELHAMRVSARVEEQKRILLLQQQQLEEARRMQQALAAQAQMQAQRQAQMQAQQEEEEMLDSAEFEPAEVSVEASMTTSGLLQTGMLTMNSLMAMNEMADWWKAPIDMERKPTIAPAPLPSAALISASASIPPPATSLKRPFDGAGPQALSRSIPAAAALARPALLIYEDPTPTSSQQPSAWIAEQIARPAVLAAVAQIKKASAYAFVLQGNTAFESHRSMVVLDRELTAGKVWLGTESERNENEDIRSDFGSVVVRFGSRASLIWYAYISSLLAASPAPPHGLVSPLSFVEHSGACALVMPFLDKPSLTELIEVAATKPLDEALAAYWALEVLTRVEELHECGVVHGQVEMAHHWQYSEGVDNRLRLLDYSLAIPIVDFNANTFAPPASHSLASLLPAKWSVHIDYLGTAQLLHLLLFTGKPLRSTLKDGRVQVEMPELPKGAKLEADWAQVFSVLLNVQASPLPPLASARPSLEKLVSSRAAKLKPSLSRMKVAVIELLAAKRPSNL